MEASRRGTGREHTAKGSEGRRRSGKEGAGGEGAGEEGAGGEGGERRWGSSVEQRPMAEREQTLSRRDEQEQRGSREQQQRYSIFFFDSCDLLALLNFCFYVLYYCSILFGF